MDKKEIITMIDQQMDRKSFYRLNNNYDDNT